MKGIQAVENRVLERLNTGLTVHDLFATAVKLIAEAVGQLITQAFRKDDYAVKYAVEPLLEGNGPLAELSVRLKLIYALGVITRSEYEDCELLMAILDELNSDSEPYSFISDEILGPIGLLHDMVLPPRPQTMADSDSDKILATMQKQRYQQMIRSAFVLSVSELVVRISRKKAF